LLAIAVSQSTMMLNVMASSRASSAPTRFSVNSVSAIEIHFPAQCLSRLIRPQVLDKQIHHQRRRGGAELWPVSSRPKAVQNG